MQKLKDFVSKSSKKARLLFLAGVALVLAGVVGVVKGMPPLSAVKAKAAAVFNKDNDNNDPPPPTVDVIEEVEVLATPEPLEDESPPAAEEPPVDESPPEPTPESPPPDESPPETGCTDTQYAIVPPGANKAVLCVPGSG